MGTPLTIDEKARILRYLGYPNWRSLAQSFQLGFPSEGQPEFLVRLAFDRIAPESLELIREDLCQLRSIEGQRAEARGRFKATSIGNLKINQREIAMLERENKYWMRRLSDNLGVYENPWSSFALAGGGSQINAKVLGS